MEATKQNKVTMILKKIKSWWINMWKSSKDTFFFLFVIFTIVLAIMVIGTTVQGGFFHFNTDDVIQYYPFMSGFIDKLKNGQLSLYDTTLFGGTSFFAGVYYLPFDIFTLLTLLLSFVMENETAYSLCNFLRPMAGALLLFYVLSRKGMKNKTSFIVSLIYFFGGMTQAYYVFPVYLGINFYAPLAMLLVDLCLEKKGAWYLLLPLFSVVVILYDFYLAYMILAFLMIYFIVRMHMRNDFSFFGRNTFIINRQFWIRFLECISLVILGVAMAAFMLIPSIQYVLTESSRNASNVTQNLWYFTVYDNDLKKQVISWRHYFTQWCNFFIPNEPHKFMLQAAGDYVKEHATFYMTCGGLVYLFYFFSLRGKDKNRLKFWIIFLNILFAIPIFAMIFTANAQPYVRWFFLPYMFNLYAMAIAMDEHDFSISRSNWGHALALFTFIAGLTTLIFVIVKKPAEFIHYNSTDQFFYPILGISIAILFVYLIILIVQLVLVKLKKNKILFKKAIPVIISLECVFAGVLIFVNIDNTSSGYYNNKDIMMEMKDALYEYGYTDESGYRINIYDNSAKSTANSNTLIGNVNFGRFFQSFYNTPLNNCLNNIFREGSTSWSRAFNGGYNLMSSNVFNNKYVVVYTRQGIHFPEEYYTKLGEKGNYTYYELKDIQPFIVYDKAFTAVAGSTIAKRQEAILKYAYVTDPGNIDISSLDPEKDKKKIDEYNLYKRYIDLGIEMGVNSDVARALKGEHKSTSVNKSKIEVVNGNNYFCYDIKGLSVSKSDVLQVFPLSSAVREVTYEDLFIRDTDGRDHGMHYTTAYLEDSWTPDKLFIRTNDTSTSSYIDLFGYSYNAYEAYLEAQSVYTDKSFKIDGSKLYIQCSMPSTDKVRIIKTGFAYSEDWVVDGYETINVDGGFLGIVVDKGIKNVDIVVSYEPKGFSTGCKITLVSCIIYAGITIPVVVIIIRKRKEKDEKDIDNSPVL